MKIKVFLNLLLLSVLSGCGNSSYYYDNQDYYEDETVTGVTSDNWDCTDDCSGHEAGYEWAADNGTTDPYDCGGNSDSFIEGCEAYANEYGSDQADEYYDDEEYEPW